MGSAAVRRSRRRDSRRSSRVILFDKRGSGLSDPVNELPTLEARMDDVRAVLDALGSDRVALWAGQEGTRLAVLFAATYPERTRALVMYDPSARGLWAPDYPWAPNQEEWAAELREVAEHWGDRDFLADRGAPVRAVARHMTSASSTGMSGTRAGARAPSEAVAFHRMMMDGDVRDVLPAVRCPTLVFHRAASREEVGDIASRDRGREAGRGSRIGGRLQLGEPGSERVHARRDPPLCRRRRPPADRRPSPRDGVVH